MILKKIYNHYFSSSRNFSRFIGSVVGYIPSNLDYYRPVFQHKSLFPEPFENYERLELLGDAVLNSIISEYLYLRYPEKKEGSLTSLRSKIVNRKQLNNIGNLLGLIEYVQYDHKSTNGIQQDISGNAFEALIGAIYMDSGYDQVRKFVVEKVIKNHLDIDHLEETIFDFKSKLYQYSQKNNIALKFDHISEEIIENRKFFKVEAYVDGELVSNGEGFSKKSAEQVAAKKALEIVSKETIS
ncbi:MAG: ribonuclease III [Chitinophagales bacterium]|nr:ribonuclease III [Chitinophagales bacterium]